MHLQDASSVDDSMTVFKRKGVMSPWRCLRAVCEQENALVSDGRDVITDSTVVAAICASQFKVVCNIVELKQENKVNQGPT